eukprot:5377630-Prymnesium_polylepis.1
MCATAVRLVREQSALHLHRDLHVARDLLAAALATVEAVWALRCCELRPPESTHALKRAFAAMAAVCVAHVCP